MRLVLAASVLLCACASETTLLVGPRYNGHYTEIAAQITVAYRMGDKGVCAYQHQSEVRNGPPFNDKPEQTSDFLGCGWRWDER